jgi:GT2 family glycosyltransferase
MRVSAVIPTKARPEPLRAALASAAAAASAADEVLVVDGDPERSALPVVEEIRARHPQARLRHVPSDPGLPLQRNVGIDAAEGEIVAFFDDDVTFPPTLFDGIAAAFADPAVVGVTGRVVENELPRIGSGQHSRLRRLLLGGGRQGTMTSFGSRRPIVDVDEPHDVEFMEGPFMTARRDVAASVRLDETLIGYALGEDDDYSYRVSLRGRVRYVPELAIEHHEIGFKSMDLRRRDRFQIINRTYLFRKNFARTRRSRAAYAGLVAMMFVHRAVNREWDGLRGLWDGLGHLRRHGALRPDLA